MTNTLIPTTLPPLHGLYFTLSSPSLQRVERAVSLVSRLVPVSLEELRDDDITAFWERLQELDRIESLSEQILLLEERLPSCE